MSVQLSVLVPARNEEANLPRLLRSFARAGFKPLEIIVIDDGSTDQTVFIAREHGARVLTAPPLPQGWTGKTWACHQGAMEAKGDTLLFLDADTFLEKDGLARLVARFIDLKSEPLSVLPYHRVEKYHEQFSFFFQFAMSAGVVGNGQLAGPCLMIDARTYRSCGGHEEVRGEVLENLFLAKRLQGIGARPRCELGSNKISIRMYPEGWAQMTEGWVKAFARGSNQVSAARIALVTAVMLLAWTGFINVAIIAFFRAGLWPWVLGTYVIVATFLFALSRKFGSFSASAFALYPLLLIYFQAAYMRSSRQDRKGVRAIWKGRTVPKVG